MKTCSSTPSSFPATTSLAPRNLPALDTAEEEKRTTGILSMLAERFRESGHAPSASRTPSSSCPSVNFGPADVAPLYGYALADAIATRLARMSIARRPPIQLADDHPQRRSSIP